VRPPSEQGRCRTSRVFLRSLALLIGALLCACIVLPMPLPTSRGQSDLIRACHRSSFRARPRAPTCGVSSEPPTGKRRMEAGFATARCTTSPAMPSQRQGASAGYGPNLEIRRFVVGLDAAGIVERVRDSRIVCLRAGAPSFAYRCVDERGANCRRTSGTKRISAGSSLAQRDGRTGRVEQFQRLRAWARNMWLTPSDAPGSAAANAVPDSARRATVRTSRSSDAGDVS